MPLPIEVVVGLSLGIRQCSVGGGSDFPAVFIGRVGAGKGSVQQKFHGHVRFLFRVEVDHGLVDAGGIKLKVAFINAYHIRFHSAVIPIVIDIFVGAKHLIAHTPILGKRAVDLQFIGQGDHIGCEEAVCVDLGDANMRGGILAFLGGLLVQPLVGVLHKLQITRVFPGNYVDLRGVRFHDLSAICDLHKAAGVNTDVL